VLLEPRSSTADPTTSSIRDGSIYTRIQIVSGRDLHRQSTQAAPGAAFLPKPRGGAYCVWQGCPEKKPHLLRHRTNGISRSKQDQAMNSTASQHTSTGSEQSEASSAHRLEEGGDEGSPAAGCGSPRRRVITSLPAAACDKGARTAGGGCNSGSICWVRREKEAAPLRHGHALPLAHSGPTSRAPTVYFCLFVCEKEKRLGSCCGKAAGREFGKRTNGSLVSTRC
jgi:hypothetical protein